jgi:diguanylate cyclase (GGDEF)-like protein/PAS domain S-box-containing protein
MKHHNEAQQAAPTYHAEILRLRQRVHDLEQREVALREVCARAADVLLMLDASGHGIDTLAAPWLANEEVHEISSDGVVDIMFVTPSPDEMRRLIRHALDIRREVPLMCELHYGNDRHWFRGALVPMGSALVCCRLHAIQPDNKDLRKFQHAVEQSPASIVITDTKGIIEYVNPKFTEVTGYTLEEAIGQNPRILKSGEMGAEGYQELWETIRAGKEWRGEFHNRRKNGELFWEFASISPIFAENHVIVGFVAVKEDITERKAMDEALRRSEEHYRLLAENVTDMISCHTPDGVYRYASPSCLSLTGYTPHELQGHQSYDFIHPADLEHIRASHAMLLDVPATYTATYRVRHKNGTYIWVESSVHTLRHPDTGAVLEIIAVSRDVSERKHMETRLERSLAMLEATLESSADGILVIADNGSIVTYNHRFEEMWHLPDGWVALPTQAERFQLLVERVQDPDAFVRGVEALYHTPEELAFDTVVLHDGRIFERSSTPYRVDNTIAGRVWNFRDVSERRRMEQELSQANQQLSHRVEELKQHNTDMRLLNAMSDAFQRCETPADAYEVASTFIPQFFAGQSGALYILDPHQENGQRLAAWGEQEAPPQLAAHEACPALCQGTICATDTTGAGAPCPPLDAAAVPGPRICTPLVVQGEHYGVLCLSGQAIDMPAARERWERLATMMSERLALTLANLHLRERLREQSVRDPLTGLFNRRYLDETLRREFRRAMRHSYPLGIVMLDVDYFKQFNDTYGHDGGDALLREVGRLLQSHIRGDDIACRYGGEEFTLVLPGASPHDTFRRAEHVRESVKRLMIEHHGQTLPPVSISAGVAVFPRHGLAGDMVLRAADGALLQAKAAGRDRVLVAAAADDYSEDPPEA